MTDQAFTPEERTKLLAKIKKCLALSGSSEPHEAAAAMRQAQKLMDRLGITPEEAAAPEIESTVVKTREGFGRCVYMAHLISLITRCFAVDAVQEPNPGSANRLNVRYIGPSGRVQLAEYTHRVIQRAVDAAWEAHLAQYPHHKGNGGKRTSFRVGWLDTVATQVEAMAITDVEQRAIASWKDVKYRGAIVQRSPTRRLDVGVFRAGMQAAEDFTLHRPMANEKLKIGNS